MSQHRFLTESTYFLLKLDEIALYDMKINYIINITVLLSLQLKMFFNISWRSCFFKSWNTFLNSNQYWWMFCMNSCIFYLLQRFCWFLLFLEWWKRVDRINSWNLIRLAWDPKNSARCVFRNIWRNPDFLEEITFVNFG